MAGPNTRLTLTVIQEMTQIELNVIVIATVTSSILPSLYYHFTVLLPLPLQRL